MIDRLLHPAGAGLRDAGRGAIDELGVRESAEVGCITLTLKSTMVHKV